MSTEELSIYNRQQGSLSLQSIICARVVQYATTNGMKQADVCRTLEANKIKISQDVLYQLKTGRYQRQIPIYTLIAICEAVGLSINDFVTVHSPEDGKRIKELLK